MRVIPTHSLRAGKLYEEHCEECHGMKAEGTERGPSLLKEQVQQATPGGTLLDSKHLERAPANGMPDWSKVPEPERWQIITFLKSFTSLRGIASNDRVAVIRIARDLSRHRTAFVDRKPGRGATLESSRSNISASPRGIRCE